ncbi:hypothetical protein M427DRAFT_152151 [Gonapodya prolifera JEL478]|uniref:Uncharacterized protein n=1 Tax=Gonapodya prolifera (strain JEL478) TaxID=1344416 RepID=A0A139AU85_GONPJ|nr:hypothetical protein M427DRAFT_152151 [Gonapodya prolifera JEL478]|eukprot:KXS20291.1 hypothetical protein M427DRAFT_152151 [Gonapodya prolifera JEL478]
MGEQLLSILARLAKENMRPPLAAMSSNGSTSSSGAANGLDNSQEDWTMIANPDEDADSHDPRWKSMFQHFFIDPPDPLANLPSDGDSFYHSASSSSEHGQGHLDEDEHDDMLFFVKKNRSPPSGGDALMVRRKVSNTLPTLPEPVDWKSTFWLNVVIQCACRLTVTVCVRESVSDEGLDGSEGKGATSTKPSKDGSTDNSKKRAVMRPLRRISRKVYPSAYRTNMADKESAHEPSFPHIYFSQLNFQDSELHLDVCPGEWLCVELAVVVPGGASGSAGGSSTSSPMLGRRGIGVAAEGAGDVDTFYDLPLTGQTPPVLRRASTSSSSLSASTGSLSSSLPAHLQHPFPTPAYHRKVVLFQGAVAYSALHDVYVQKASSPKGGAAPGGMFGLFRSATDNGMLARRQSWTLFGLFDSSNNKGDGYGKGADVEELLEYIMMRGPKGKGQCQVAVSRSLRSLPSNVVLPPRAPSTPPMTSVPRTHSLYNTYTSPPTDPARASFDTRASFVRTRRTFTRPPSTAVQSERPKDDAPTVLKASMTFITVPYGSVARDLTDFYAKRRL